MQTIKHTLLRRLPAALLLASLAACTVVPAAYPPSYPQGYYRPPRAYVETYPVYARPAATFYYETGHRHEEHWRDEHRDSRRYGEQRFDDRRDRSLALPSPLELHREVRRGLGLPRLPGLP